MNRLGEVDRQQGVGRRRRQLDSHVVDLAGAAQVRHARSRDADLTGVEVRCILLEHLLDVPDHRVGVEIGAVVELHAGTQLEDPFGLVVGRDVPFGRKAWDHHARLVGGGEVPGGEPLVHRVAGEAVALKTLVRLTERSRNVGRGHADAHDCLRTCRHGRRGQQPGHRRATNNTQQYELVHDCLLSR